MTITEVMDHLDNGEYPFVNCYEDDLIPVHSTVLNDGALSFSCPECDTLFCACSIIWMSKDEASDEGWEIREHVGIAASLPVSTFVS